MWQCIVEVVAPDGQLLRCQYHYLHPGAVHLFKWTTKKSKVDV